MGSIFFFLFKEKPCPRAFRWHRKVETLGKGWRWDWDEVMGQVAEALPTPRESFVQRGVSSTKSLREEAVGA